MDIQSCKPTSSVLITTLNTSHLRQASQDLALARIVSDSFLLIADGMPVKFICKHILKMECCRITGVKLVEKILNNFDKVFVLGSSARAIEDSLVKLDLVELPSKVFYNDLNIDLNSESQLIKIVAQINLEKPQLVLLALGIPKQELMFENLKKSGLIMKPTIFIGVGGTFEILSGRFPRCPGPLQVIGLEWLWRLSMEPKRLFRRYLFDGVFLLRLLSLHLISSVRNR
jgi:N-acetylglucosaminyldiphosphoundecaprenol N-acetyl-beta-D-mannosaminyltransferase